MEKEELISRLGKYEWNDFECKKCQRGISEDVYQTVSAFANTKGGWLVFGIEDNHGGLSIVGVIEVDKVQNDFLSALRSDSKIKPFVGVRNEEIIDYVGKKLLVFYIPESPRSDKPVHLNKDIMNSYIRRGGSDEKCNIDEIKRFLRDGSPLRYDCEPITEISHDNFFDSETVNWYRRIFNQKEPGRYETLSDIDFLHELGFIIEKEGRLYPIRAGILAFGKDKYVRQILNRIVVDFQRIDVNFNEWTPELRWHDRITPDVNLFKTWQIIVQKYMAIAEKPFSIDLTTLRRHDEPGDYIAFREAAINLLIHQDFGDSGRIPYIKFFKDRVIFWNPGDAFNDEAELLEPRSKEVRNPSVVSAFRRIGLSDQAGTGVSTIFRTWRGVGNVPPQVVSNKPDKFFQLSLLKEELLTEEQLLYQASIGVHLSEDQAAVFAFACQNKLITLTDVKAITGLNIPDCQQIILDLTRQVLLKQIDTTTFEIADQLKGLPFIQKGGAAIQVPESIKKPEAVTQSEVKKTVTPVIKLSEMDLTILSLCEIPRSLTEILDETGYKSRMHFRDSFIVPLINRGLIVMTKPDKPQASNQKYMVTDAGMKIIQHRKKPSS